MATKDVDLRTRLQHTSETNVSYNPSLASRFQIRMERRTNRPPVGSRLTHLQEMALTKELQAKPLSQDALAGIPISNVQDSTDSRTFENQLCRLAAFRKLDRKLMSTLKRKSNRANQWGLGTINVPGRGVLYLGGAV